MDEEAKQIVRDEFLRLRREERNKLLAQSDKYLIADYPISAEKLELIKIYRQQLRDYMNLEEVKNFDYYSGTPIKPFPEFSF